jgi:hypothetical protein
MSTTQKPRLTANQRITTPDSCREAFAHVISTADYEHHTVPQAHVALRNVLFALAGKRGKLAPLVAGVPTLDMIRTLGGERGGALAARLTDVLIDSYTGEPTYKNVAYVMKEIRAMAADIERQEEALSANMQLMARLQGTAPLKGE